VPLARLIAADPAPFAGGLAVAVTAHGSGQCPAAEVDEIRRASDLQGDERQLGRHEQGGDAHAGGPDPHRLPAHDAGGGAEAGAAPAGERVRNVSAVS
jgi:hypothetical protein